EPLVKKLDRLGVVLYSTGGTETFIRDLGIKVIPVEEITGYPSILGGRVKNLHPKVFGSILNRSRHPGAATQIQEFENPQLDLVIVDLCHYKYPVASGGSEADLSEKIDLWVISSIRAAVKNFLDGLCVSSR